MNKKNRPAILDDKEFKEATLQRAKVGDIQLSTTRWHEVNGHCAIFDLSSGGVVSGSIASMKKN